MDTVDAEAVAAAGCCDSDNIQHYHPHHRPSSCCYEEVDHSAPVASYDDDAVGAHAAVDNCSSYHTVVDHDSYWGCCCCYGGEEEEAP